MNQAFLDYYSLEPFTQWIHRTLCGVMPEDWAVFIEGLALGIVILLAYAVLAVVLIYMERRVCGAFQCRIGPNRVGGKGGLLQVPADVLKILTKEIIRLRKSDHVLYELAPYLVILASVISFSCLPWHKGAEVLDMQIGIFFVLAASSIGVIGILLAGWSSNSKYTIIGAVRSGAMIISYELSLGITVLTMVVLSGTMSISGIVESTYGYHIILRLPIQAADYRDQYVSYLMSQRQQGWLEQFPVETNDEYKKIDPAAFYTQLTALRTAVQAEVTAAQEESSGDSSSSSSGSSSGSSSAS